MNEGEVKRLPAKTATAAAENRSEWFPLVPDTFCLFRCSPARKLPPNAGTLDY